VKPVIKPGCLCLVRLDNPVKLSDHPPHSGDTVTAVRYLGTHKMLSGDTLGITPAAWVVTNAEIEAFLQSNGGGYIGVSASYLIPISDPDSINSSELWDKLPNEPEQVVSDLRKALRQSASKV
jgi:hypothetical protein